MRRRNPLIVSAYMRQWWLDNKIHALVIMRPEDFLSLTSSPWHKEEIMKEAAPLSTYNEYVASGQCGIIPMLKINRDPSEPLKTGRVVGHEGRHRAAAVIKVGEAEYMVGLKFVDDFVATRQLSFVDCPLKWYPEEGADFNAPFYAFNLIRVEQANVQCQYQKSPPLKNISLTKAEIRMLFLEREAALRKLGQIEGEC